MLEPFRVVKNLSEINVSFSRMLPAEKLCYAWKDTGTIYVVI